jgi:RNA polymerase sigma factor (sigma-70 family)
MRGGTDQSFSRQLSSLLQRARAGDDAAANQFSRKVIALAHNACIRFGVKETYRDDIVAEVMLVWAKILRDPGFTVHTSCSALVVRMVHNLHLNWLRSPAKNDALLLGRLKGDAGKLLDSMSARAAEWPGARLERQEIQRIVQEVIDDLPEINRRIVCLYYQEGLMQREIADRLGLPKGTVANKLHRVIRVLAKKLGERAGGRSGIA